MSDRPLTLDKEKPMSETFAILDHTLTIPDPAVLDPGAISERWEWNIPFWSIYAADRLTLIATVSTTTHKARIGDAEREPVTSIRDGMRRCEARLAGGAS